jgi:hypothetical protein
MKTTGSRRLKQLLERLRAQAEAAPEFVDALEHLVEDRGNIPDLRTDTTAAEAAAEAAVLAIPLLIVQLDAANRAWVNEGGAEAPEEAAQR